MNVCRVEKRLKGAALRKLMQRVATLAEKMREARSSFPERAQIGFITSHIYLSAESRILGEVTLLKALCG